MYCISNSSWRLYEGHMVLSPAEALRALARRIAYIVLMLGLGSHVARGLALACARILEHLGGAHGN